MQKRKRLDARTNLRIDQRVLAARDEHKALDLCKVGELGRVELADRDRVRLLVLLLQQRPKVL